MKIHGSVFIVTGGASGLGAATARMLVAGGARVVVADLKDAEGRSLAAELGPAVRYVSTDVTDEAAGVAAVAAAVEGFGGLQGLVNCAGIVHGEKVVGNEGPHALATFARAVNINLVGSFNMTRLAAHAMAKGTPNEEGERGVVVYTASVAAFDGQIGQAAYAASKAGLVGMTLPVARELARHGIRVMTIAPGHLPHADDGEPHSRGAGLAGQDGALSAAPRAPGGVRLAGPRDRRQSDAERGGHPAGRRHPDGAAVGDAFARADGRIRR